MKDRIVEEVESIVRCKDKMKLEKDMNESEFIYDFLVYISLILFNILPAR
jgi:hypothetical protein